VQKLHRFFKLGRELIYRGREDIDIDKDIDKDKEEEKKASAPAAVFRNFYLIKEWGKQQILSVQNSQRFRESEG
jgi:hypothetical protein